MAPLIPRMHVFEINDQDWFPAWFRGRIQASLTRAWIMRVPILQQASPAEHVAQVLRQGVLDGADASRSSHRPWIMIDFCAGGGGPTPRIESIVNEGSSGSGGSGGSSSSSSIIPTKFVLTDLHPHVDEWTLAAARSRHVHFAPEPVDASAAEPAAILRAAGLDAVCKPGTNTSMDPRVFRLFSLAFHHFDDPMARAILKNTIETSDGFGIFELQDRSFSAFCTTLIFGVGILLTAPYYAWQLGSPLLNLLFTYVLPVLPFVLVFDGWMSMLRTRTPDEVATLLRTCGAEAAEVERWELRSGEVRHLWPCGYLKWIVCVKKA